MRKERLGTFLHEADFYRRRRPDLQILFIVNDYAMNVMHYLVTDPLVDRAYHVNLPLFLHLHDPFRGSEAIPKEELLKDNRALTDWHAIKERAFDLPALFKDIASLYRAAPAPELDADALEEAVADEQS